MHPYYKFDYIESQWGGEKEQEEELLNGNADAKNWVLEVRKIVEKTVHDHQCFLINSNSNKILRWQITGPCGLKRQI